MHAHKSHVELAFNLDIAPLISLLGTLSYFQVPYVGFGGLKYSHRLRINCLASGELLYGTTTKN